jgi:NACHT domain
MSSDLSLIASNIQAELAKVGLADAKVVVVSLDNANDALMVTVESAAFDGQTFLDREMRVRPVVARALNLSSMPKAAYVIEALSPDDANFENTDDRLGVPEASAPALEPNNRRALREQRNSILRAFRANNYTVEELEQDKVTVASRTLLSDETILVGFAQSTNATTVDIDVRKAMQIARQARSFSACYFLTLEPLAKPFSNQGAADWLIVETSVQFMHRLNSSTALARKLSKQCSDDLDRSAQECAGPVIEPTTKAESGSVACFDYIRSWANQPEASFLILVAPAGYGKTTITLELVRQFADDFLRSMTRPVPLLVPFEAVRRTVDFEALMHKRLAQLGGGAFGVFAELLRNANAVLFVDGFDELADDAGTSVAENQIRSMRALVQGRAKVVLAGRSAFAQQFAGDMGIIQRVRSLLGDVRVETLEILPFDLDQVAKFVSTRQAFGSEHQTSLISFAQSSPDHEEICGSPLFLRVLCTLAKEGELPENTEVADGVQYIVDKVCEREETRQHLGIGTSAQLGYLGDVALQIFRAGQAGTSREEVQFYAAATAERMSVPTAMVAELVGRLTDHALLAPWAEMKLSFIHPIIRDVLLGRALAHVAAGGHLGEFNGYMGIRDLPEGTVRYLARSSESIFDAVPAEWLSKQGRFSTQTRRNLVRVALEKARRGDNPRQWVDGKWINDRLLLGLDLSNLPLASVSFDGLLLKGVDFSNAVFEDCDFIGTRFESCDVSSALLLDCRASAETVLEATQITGATVRAGDVTSRVQTGQDLLAALVGAGSPDFTVPLAVPTQMSVLLSTADVRRRCLTLTAQILENFVRTEDAAVKFDSVRRVGFPRQQFEGREWTAVDKVIAPMIISAFCDIELSAGSKENLVIAKRWRSPIVEFVRRGRLTTNLRDVFDLMVARAARYL